MYHYKPKKYLIEKQIDFGRDTIRNNSTISRWYSTEMVSNLKKEYEEENNFKYDWVMVYRLDHIFLTPLNFSKFDNEFIYFRHSNGLAAPQHFSHGYKVLMVGRRYTQLRVRFYLLSAQLQCQTLSLESMHLRQTVLRSFLKEITPK